MSEKIGFEYQISADSAVRTLGELERRGADVDRSFAKSEKSAKSFENSLRDVNKVINTSGAKEFAAARQTAFSDLESRAKAVLTSVQRINSAGEKVNLSNGFAVDFAKIEQSAEKTRKALHDALNQKISTNNLDGTAQALIRAQNESTKLRSRLTEIKSAIENTNPSKTSLLKIMAQDARAAEIELAKLERFQTRLEAKGSIPAAGLFSKNPGQARYQKQQLLYQANDVATMAAMGANPTQIIASQAGQVAQIFDPKQITAFVSAYAGLVTVVTAGAAAIALTYKITGDIRAEAERRLHYEEKIQGAINKQIIAQRESLQNFKDLREEAERNRTFQGYLQTETLESLKARLATRTQLVNLDPNGKDSETTRKEILELEAQIAALQKKKAQDPYDTFRRQMDLDEKAREDALRFEQKKQEAYQNQVEAIKKTRNELKTFLTDAAAQENPLVKLFIDSASAAEKLREQYKALGKEVGDYAAKLEIARIQQKITETTFNNQFDALRHRQEAARLRDLPIIGLTGSEERKLDTLQAKISATMVEFEAKQQANYWRSLNSFNPNSGQLFPTADLNSTFEAWKNSKNSFDKQRLSEVGQGQIRDVIAEVLRLRAQGGDNVRERDLIAQAVESVIKKIPADLLRKDQSSDIRFLREILAQTFGDKAAAARENVKEALQREKAGEYGRNQATAQVAFINKQGGFRDKDGKINAKPENEFRANALLGVLGQLAPNELTGSLRKSAIDANLALAEIKTKREVEALDVSKQILKVMQKIDAQLGGNGIKVDAGKGLVDVTVNDKRTDVKDNRPSNADVQKQYGLVNGDYVSN